MPLITFIVPNKELHTLSARTQHTIHNTHTHTHSEQSANDP